MRSNNYIIADSCSSQDSTTPTEKDVVPYCDFLLVTKDFTMTPAFYYPNAIVMAENSNWASNIDMRADGN